MKFSKLIKNKKGVVLEAAVIFMVLIFTFCLVLSTATLTGYNRVRIENIKLENDREAELMVEEIIADYLVYIEAIELKIPEPVTTAPPETQLSPESSGGIAQDTTKPNNEETITPPAPPPQFPDEPDNGDVVNVPVDIMPETPLLSPLSNTEEITAASTQPPAETTLTVMVVSHPKFEDLFRYDGLECVSGEILVSGGTTPKIFLTLNVYNEANVCVLEIQICQSISKVGNNIIRTTISQYINKSPQNNYQPEGN